MLTIELARRLKNWSQSDLGNHRKVKIGRSFISMIERGRALPVPAQAERLAEVLDLPVERLLEPVAAVPKNLPTPDDAEQAVTRG